MHQLKDLQGLLGPDIGSFSVRISIVIVQRQAELGIEAAGEQFPVTFGNREPVIPHETVRWEELNEVARPNKSPGAVDLIRSKSVVCECDVALRVVRVGAEDSNGSVAVEQLEKLVHVLCHSHSGAKPEGSDDQDQAEAFLLASQSSFGAHDDLHQEVEH